MNSVNFFQPFSTDRVPDLLSRLNSYLGSPILQSGSAIGVTHSPIAPGRHVAIHRTCHDTRFFHVVLTAAKSDGRKKKISSVSNNFRQNPDNRNKTDRDNFSDLLL